MATAPLASDPTDFVQPAAPSCLRVCLRHRLPLDETQGETANRPWGDSLHCPGPAPRRAHRVFAWGVFSIHKDRIVAIGSADKIVLLDDFDYPRKVADVFGAEDVVAEAVSTDPNETGRRRLNRQIVAALKRDVAVPGWRMKEILLRYDISRETLRYIRGGRIWASVPGPAPVPPDRSKQPPEKPLTFRGRDC